MNDNTKPTFNRAILPLVLFFCITTVLLIAGKSLLVQWGVDQPLLIAGNMLLFYRKSYFASFVPARHGTRYYHGFFTQYLQQPVF